MQIEYEISEQDFVDANWLALRKYPKRATRIFVRVVPYLGAALFLIVVWDLLTRKEFSTSHTVALVIGALCVSMPFMTARSARKMYRQNASLHGKRPMVLNNGGMSLSGPSFSSQVEWNIFIRLVEDDKIFLAYQSPQTFHLIPKRELSPQQIAELREILSHNIAAKG